MISSILYALAQSKGLDFELVLTQDSKEAQLAFEVLDYLSPQSKITPFILPEFRAVYGDDLRSFSQEFSTLTHTLKSYYTQEGNKILISPISSVMYALPTLNHLNSFVLKKEQDYPLQELKEKLLLYGYEFVDFVEMEGEVSFRGDIMDIFIPHHPRPYRISFFDIFIEEIKEFEVESQICLEGGKESIEITPPFFSLTQEEAQELEKNIQKSDFHSLSSDIQSLGFWFLPHKVLLPKILKTALTQGARQEVDEIFSFEERSDLEPKDLENAKVLEPIEGYSDVLFDPKNLSLLLQAHESKKITLLSNNNSVFENLKFHYDLEGVTLKLSPNVLHILTPTELILSLNNFTQKSRKKKPKILLDELRVGEYIVHQEYGVGIFRGIIQTEIVGSVRDFIQIDYQGEDKLLLPVENLHLIDRYIANSGTLPILDRLGKGSFAKLRDKVKSKLFEIAGGIIALAAKRDLLEGCKINTSNPEIEVFKNACDFTLTQDQEKSITEIYTDLSSGKVMDRLLSGDVGFGKTEVAMNAIFAVCKSGFQSALIAPTTLLSSQHFASLQKRFEGFNIRLAKLDSTIKNKTSVLKNIAEGNVDVVVGTHALLSATFKNLGLVVVDEEHKFGVKQKEKIKELSTNVHLLSMSATPIPRTLNMALSQIKGMSSLLTPPKEREGVRTFVKNHSEGLLKEAISRELRRGGQVFFIHNHIASIQKRKEDLLELLPNLKIAILHSQTPNSDEIMERFFQREYNLLLCTSIVESGIHLSNANTMIVEGADRFGIADLHQLRGRVGRGSKEGFCYFLIEDRESLGEEAKKRLLALEQNSYLGSGASLAYHDLEIRGGGNLLGEAQSGHIKNIGYGLYLRMLEDCINTLSGKEKLLEESVDLKLNVSAYLNPELIASDRLRLELYRRLALCKSVDEVFKIQAEIEDRFGKPDNFTKQFLDLIIIKILASACKLKMISNYAQNIAFTYQDGSKESLQSPSKDDDDVLATILEVLRKKTSLSV
ncbi:transcription-repair coupling factor [Helicobacter brantae]|uniref:Transcription-repair-coupling factor n=1 Tax=Helicobacter brantae TaxID=375927 RepID=A0A3D8J1V1_9HELI|nr:transcription-repair coupling factor [Helicobacter brantae]RDU71519.1 transcription-repair coupling factor [Helicobacter brantae]